MATQELAQKIVTIIDESTQEGQALLCKEDYTPYDMVLLLSVKRNSIYRLCKEQLQKGKQDGNSRAITPNL